MKNQKQKIVVIVGPNASGKSALAVNLARRFNGEVISADSRQVYRGLDIGTGKITPREMHGIPHYLIDVANPKQRFSVAEFKPIAEQAITFVASREKLPIVVGGTGFWIDSLVFNRELPAVAPNLKLRKALAQKNAEELFRLLRRLDPKRAKTIERKNPRRLIRAIEIAQAIGRVPKLNESRPYDALWIGIRPAGVKHPRLIRARLLKRIRSGMISEAYHLRKQGLSWKRFYELGLEYRFLADFLQKKISKVEMIAGLERAIRDYARRQMVWFKKNTAIHWVGRERDAQLLVNKFLER